MASTAEIIIVLSACFVAWLGSGLLTLRIMKKRAAKKETERRNRVDVEYLGIITKPARGGKGRVIAAGLLFGPMASMVAASLEGEDYYHRFLVRYKDGSVRTVECADGSKDYQELIAQSYWKDLPTTEQNT